MGYQLILILLLYTLHNKLCNSKEMNRHIRSNLARTLYTRILEDQREKQCDHEYWYSICEQSLPDELRKLFMKFDQDEETQVFLENCYEKADWLFTQMYYGLASAVLKWFISQTSVNGLLGRGSMFVYSSTQFYSLLELDAEWKGQALLDLGAGDGEVTKKMAIYFNEVFVTEMSTPMTWRLNEKGYKILGIDDWHGGERKYDVISCLNVLDRCEKPQTLLQNIKVSLVPGSGRAIVAIVLPYSPYVEYKYKDHMPSEDIPIKGESFEDQATSLIKDFFEPNGFKVEKFTQLPYLCEGDLEHSFFVLYDAVFVLSVP